MLYVGEVTKQQRRDFRNKVHLAYAQALWQRMDAEKLPKIDELLGDDPDATDPEVMQATAQTPSEMEGILKTLSARSKGNAKAPRVRRR